MYLVRVDEYGMLRIRMLACAELGGSQHIYLITNAHFNTDWQSYLQVHVEHLGQSVLRV